ncbi:hypothetical protein PG999_001304 [Apiospora kogelbergensis]|uniref:Uncharacterized protein n=1 Tax=Apiospora kogelbergensis TaxID=1337665 RepID=A0AAW0REF1_9PEZI
MVLLNGNLELLCVSSNRAVTFDLLVALVGAVYFDRDWREDLTGREEVDDIKRYDVADELYIEGMDDDISDLDAPQGVMDLADVLLETGSMELIGADRLTPIVLGTMREATASRGEAIMAVTGATGWHMGRSVTQFQNASDAEDLLFGLYPFEFIHELRQSCGAFFFMYQQEMSTLIYTEKGFIDPGFRGTMLPFMKDSPAGYNVLSTDEVGDRNVTDHPSTESWRLERDGSVWLPQVAIAAGSNCNITSGAQGLATYLIADIGYNDPYISGIRQTLHIKGDLVDIVNSLKEEAVAVCTGFSSWHIFGIILQRSTKGSGPFVKAGTFFTSIVQELDFVFSIPEPVPVNWRVL